VPASFTIAPNDSHLVETVIGHHTVQMQREVARELFAHMRATGITKVLIDARAQQRPLSTLDSVEIWDEHAPLVPRGAKFAILVNWQLNGQPFMETVAINRMVNVRYFNDYDQAVAWLGNRR
jgi:hypothetical protein